VAWLTIARTVSTESRQLRRAQKGSARPSASAPAAPQDALRPEALRSMAWRVALIVVAIWVGLGMVAGFSQSNTTRIVVLSLAAVLTALLVGVVVWALSRAKKARGVASILAGVESDEDRARAIAQLDTQFKAGDPAAVFAKAQLQMQSDPQQALATLEQLDLGKLNPSTADEARAQRGMIHLMLGDVSRARDLADGIDLTRHQDSRSKAMMSSVIAEAWARTGQAKKAQTVLEVFNPEDEAFAQMRPQLYRARAFTYAYVGDVKAMKRAVRRLTEIDVRLLGGLLAKKTHPLLQKEAKQALERSGQMPRRMQISRS
jgi:hypothetical protein